MADSDILITSLGVAEGAGGIQVNWTFNQLPAGPLPYLQLDHTELWASATNDRTTAAKVADVYDLRTQIAATPGSVNYFWARAVDKSANLGDFYPTSSTGGVQANFYGIDLTDLAADIAAWQSRASNSIREARATLQRIDQLVADGMSRSRIDIKSVRSEVASRFGEVTATYNLAIDTLAASDLALTTRVETVEATIPNLATVTVTDTLAAAITATNGNVTSIANRTTVLENAVNDPSTGLAATVTALGTLSSTVSTQGNTITANGQAIMALQGVVGTNWAGSNFRIDVDYTPSSGWTASAALQTRLGARYTTGTATFTNGSATVTGSGTSWLANAAPGDVIAPVIPGSSPSGVILTVNSNTSITLTSNWSAATVSGQPYYVDHTFRSAGLYLETKADQSRILLDADRVLITNGGTPAALFEAGTTYIKTARIANLEVQRLEISARKFTFEGIRFEYNDPATNRASWTAGTIRYVDDAGANQAASISSGSTATWTTGVLYIYWVYGATSLSSTTTIGTAFGTDRVVIATYKGGKSLAVTWGKVTLDGSLDVKLLSLVTDRMALGAVTGLEYATYLTQNVNVTTNTNFGVIWSDVITITDNASVIVRFTFQQDVPTAAASNVGNYDMRITRDGTGIGPTVNVVYDDNFGTTNIVMEVSDTPGDGTYTYGLSLDVHPTGGGGFFNLRYGRSIAQQYKR